MRLGRRATAVSEGTFGEYAQLGPSRSRGPVGINALPQCVYLIHQRGWIL